MVSEAVQSICPVLFCCWSLLPLIRCVRAFYGRHVCQKYDKLQPNLKQFEERKPSQYSCSSEMLFKWSGLLTITFGPSILMWMFGRKWPLYQKEMFFSASPNYIHSWLDPEDLMKIRLHTWNHTAEMIPLSLYAIFFAVLLKAIQDFELRYFYSSPL